ncbi:GNAT family N-acetyltransferase [Thermohalobacter berrensis]|uniref:N-acetyltransferase domain-containing protein n=1 Tax=Thermohalobacter berrensis TaxID=99594 RepID=A0A419T506_9FIRM|nr:GNAT family N-acetyltransferase [Thermohalobacter berrensis]RKD32571.1 hypothetical protein BET03_10875 [Thermohalobacter berrensis]
MFKTNNEKILNDLFKQNRIATLNSLGRLKYNNDWELFVDDKKKPSSFLIKHNYWNTLFSNDKETIVEMAKNLRGEQGFSGILKKYYQIIKKYKNIEWEEHCFLYYLDEKNIDTSRIKHDVKELKLEDAEIVNKYYTYKSEHSLEYIKRCIEERPTSAIYDENGNPISWAVVREDGSMGIMYTKKEHRGKGLALSITLDLAKKVIQSNFIPYVHIVVDNTPSLALVESAGFKKYGEVVWFGVKD